jgi:hypothetical protein
MRNVLPKIMFISALALCVGSAACTANIHDNTVSIPNANVSFKTDVDANTITPGEAVPLTMTASGVFLVDPAATPPAEHVADAGHFQIYLDNHDSDPLLITAQLQASVTIPPATPPGGHKLICEVFKHDGTPTTTSFEVNITVTVATGG